MTILLPTLNFDPVKVTFPALYSPVARLLTSTFPEILPLVPPTDGKVKLSGTELVLLKLPNFGILAKVSLL